MKPTTLTAAPPATRLRVHGPDAAVFLQGQFTANLRRPGESAATYGLWLNQKGRVLADSFVLSHGPDTFEVVSVTSPASIIRERLEAYIIADDVTVEDETDGSGGWILAGTGAAEVVRDLGCEAPAVGIFGHTNGAVVFRARSAAGPHWYLRVGPEERPVWEARFAGLVQEKRVRVALRPELAAGRIESGIPEIPAELGPTDLPNEGGLEHEALSFTKGCYLGQEVMARLHNLGKVRRRLYVVETGEPAPARAPGTSLFAGPKRVGELRSLVSAGAQWIGLAMLQTNHVALGDLLAANEGGTANLRVLRLAAGRAW